jgi:pimeloyl-ACP methyl ester carboxylesterase
MNVRLLTITSLLVVGIQAFPNNTPVYSPRPYTVNVASSLIEETQRKASSFRPSTDIDEPAWTDGPPTSDITAIAKYWVDEYSWSDVQAEMNANFSHYMTTVPPPGGSYNRPLDIHFIHQRSARADAIPMLMFHGWPSTSLEWEKVIPGLVDPADESKPAFHIVAPDLPGFGFSPAPTAPGLGPSEHGAVFASLMQQLGYKEYAVYSTDLGFIVALAMLADYESRILNHVTDFYFVLPNNTDLERYAANQTTPEETKYITAANAFFTGHSAYAEIHSTLPLSIADALNDSPVGFLAWMYQLVYTVSDKPSTAHHLITEALLLFLPGVYGNIRSYKELYPSFTLLANGELKTTAVPTSALQFGGVTSYPGFSDFTFVVSWLRTSSYIFIHETNFDEQPREWIERTANVTYFARHDVGGHFPALSEPKLLLEEIRAVFA